MNKLNILVTGSKGFVGSKTVKLLEERGHKVSRFDLMDKNDIRTIDPVTSGLANSGIDVILHLAAIARFSDADRDPWTAYMTNVKGTENVVRLAEWNKARIVYSSTGSVYMPIEQEPPITEDMQCRGNSVYGVTKYLGELAVRASKTPWIVLRYAHLYGKEKRGHGLVGAFVDRINRGLVPTLYGGSQSNDFTYIDDVARANVLACEASWDKWNDIYNIGTGEELSAEAASKILFEEMGYVGKVDKIKQRTVDAQRFVFNTSKAESKLGFKAEYDFRSGIKKMLEEMDV